MLGYPNESNETSDWRLFELFKNGTFAVFRKLEHTCQFRHYIEETAETQKIPPIRWRRKCRRARTERRSRRRMWLERFRLRIRQGLSGAPRRSHPARQST